MRLVTLILSLAVAPVSAQEQTSRYDISTPADPVAAYQDVAGMTMRDHMDDDPTNAMILVDRLERRDAPGGSTSIWDANLWIGRDFNKLLFRTEGEVLKGRVEGANLETLWARPVSRWWELVVGARQDFRPEPSRSWLALGVVGLAPYRIQVEATAYVGENARTALALQMEYELLLTNRLILQPRLELNAYGKEDRSRGIASGVSDLEFGFRLRYEIQREFAPYVGIDWVNKFGSTADFARIGGADPHELQILAGLRVWY